MNAPRTRLLLALAVAPLALGLAACKKDTAGTAAAPQGAPVAAVAPPAGKVWTDVVDETADGGMRIGNPEAPIKLVEYGSLSCPHCAKLSQEGTASLMKDYVGTGKVSWEFRSFAIHPQDVPLTVLIGCAPKEAYFPLLEQVYANFDSMNAVYTDKAKLAQAQAAMDLPAAQRWAAFSDAIGYSDFFAARGIAKNAAHACLADLNKATVIAEHAKKYGESGIDSTPTLLINGSKVEGAEWPALETALKAAGAR